MVPQNVDENVIHNFKIISIFAVCFGQVCVFNSVPAYAILNILFLQISVWQLHM